MVVLRSEGTDMVVVVLSDRLISMPIQVNITEAYHMRSPSSHPNPPRRAHLHSLTCIARPIASAASPTTSLPPPAAAATVTNHTYEFPELEQSNGARKKVEEGGGCHYIYSRQLHVHGTRMNGQYMLNADRFRLKAISVAN